MDFLIEALGHTFANISHAQQADRIQLSTLRLLLLQKGQLMLHHVQLLFQGIQHSTVITETLDHLAARIVLWGRRLSLSILAAFPFLLVLLLIVGTVLRRSIRASREGSEDFIQVS